MRTTSSLLSANTTSSWLHELVEGERSPGTLTSCRCATARSMSWITSQMHDESAHRPAGDLRACSHSPRAGPAPVRHQVRVVQRGRVLRNFSEIADGQSALTALPYRFAKNFAGVPGILYLVEIIGRGRGIRTP